MRIAWLLLPELDSEMTVTRRILERVPDGEGSGSPTRGVFNGASVVIFSRCNAVHRPLARARGKIDWRFFRSAARCMVSLAPPLAKHGPNERPFGILALAEPPDGALAPQ